MNFCGCSRNGPNVQKSVLWEILQKASTLQFVNSQLNAQYYVLTTPCKQIFFRYICRYLIVKKLFVMTKPNSNKKHVFFSSKKIVSNSFQRCTPAKLILKQHPLVASYDFDHKCKCLKLKLCKYHKIAIRTRPFF